MRVVLLCMLMIIISVGSIMIMYIIKKKIEEKVEGMLEGMLEKYDDTVKTNNTNINCEIFCKNLSSIKENCESYNENKIQKCLNNNNKPIQPKCHYKEETSMCMNVS